MKDRMKGKAREMKGRATGEPGEEMKGKAQKKVGEAKQEAEAATRKRRRDDLDR
ncbi:MAG: hypothetical protein J2P43_06225 [Candidatus Dormibacteraeota bacterium]|nr:hypothetical protein [Candidatus Dormibacteraeota bacterium]MBO0744596.1 hypothetical protein [Candidatus Dormibacteraeota bacterium]